jgi:hypothetical protein
MIVAPASARIIAGQTLLDPVALVTRGRPALARSGPPGVVVPPCRPVRAASRPRGLRRGGDEERRRRTEAIVLEAGPSPGCRLGSPIITSLNAQVSRLAG